VRTLAHAVLRHQASPLDEAELAFEDLSLLGTDEMRLTPLLASSSLASGSALAAPPGGGLGSAAGRQEAAQRAAAAAAAFGRSGGAFGQISIGGRPAAFRCLLLAAARC
jgi:hypothetical protein